MKRKFELIGNKKSSGIYGNSLEKYFGINPNSSKKQDLPTGDIKTHLLKSSSPTTLLSRTPKKCLTSEFIKTYGKYNVDENKYSFNVSLSTEDSNPYEQGNIFSLFVDRKEKKIYLIINGNIIDTFFWNFLDIYEALNEKLKNIHFFIISPIGKEEAQIEEEYYYSNINNEKFIEEIEKGSIVLGFACSLNKSGKIKNHGCTFRTHHKNLHKLYEKSSLVSV